MKRREGGGGGGTSGSQVQFVPHALCTVISTATTISSRTPPTRDLHTKLIAAMQICNIVPGYSHGTINRNNTYLLAV